MAKTIDLKRAVVKTGDVGTTRTWYTRDGKTALVYSTITLGMELPKYVTRGGVRMWNHARYQDRWLVLLHRPGTDGKAYWMIHSTHTKRSAAERSLVALNPLCLTERIEPMTATSDQLFEKIAAAGDQGYTYKASTLSTAATARALAKRNMVKLEPAADGQVKATIVPYSQTPVRLDTKTLPSWLRLAFGLIPEVDRGLMSVTELVDAYFDEDAMAKSGMDEHQQHAWSMTPSDERAALVRKILKDELAAAGTKPEAKPAAKPAKAAKAKANEKGPEPVSKFVQSLTQPAAPAAPVTAAPSYPELAGGSTKADAQLYNVWLLNDGRVFALLASGKREFDWMKGAKIVGQLKADNRDDARQRGSKAIEAAKPVEAAPAAAEPAKGQPVAPKAKGKKAQTTSTPGGAGKTTKKAEYIRYT
jgi:hypothetical protein